MTSTFIPPHQPVDAGLLAARLANPQRPQLTDATAAVCHVTSGADAWQTLVVAGLIPANLLGAAERRFAVVDTERGAAALIHDEIELRAEPATVSAAVTLASDIDAVLEAERLARALRARLVPWGAAMVDRIDWVVLSHQVHFSFELGPACKCALYSLADSLEHVGVDVDTLRVGLPWLPPFVNQVLQADEGWMIAAKEGLEISATYGPPPELIGRSFDTLENPFEIALRLWAEGYVLDHFSSDDLPTARLSTCVIGAPQNLPWQLREQAQNRTR